MESVFLHLLNMSITAGWLVLAVMVLRLLMKRAPRWMVCLLWVLVAVRLICPVSVESVLSLIPSTETVPTDVVMGSTPTINSGVPVVDAVVNPIISDTLAPTPEYSADPVQIATFVAANVWVIGMVAMLLYALISTLRLRWQVRESACLRRNIRQCDRIATPFILGIIRPRIYLPSTLPAQDVLSVVAHEEAHIQRRDHWWKPLGYLLLTVYWFNPLLWVGYILLCRDIEAACDERVIRDMDVEQRRRYSEALLACSMPRRMISACPLAFGETGVKSRIKSVLSYKKPTFWIVLLAVVLTIVAAVCLLTNPKEKPDLGDLDAYLTQVILEQNKKETADGIFACEAHEVFGTKENGRTTTVYGLVYYHEYTYVDGDLLERSGSCLPTAITVKKKGKTYQLVEYWVPGIEYAKDLQAKFPEDYHSKVIDYPAADLVALLKAECVSKAWTHFTADAPEEQFTREFYHEFVANSYNWLSEDKLQELTSGAAYHEGALPLLVLNSPAEVEAFIEKYDEDMGLTRNDSTGVNVAAQMREAYTQDFFDRNIVLAVYYKDGSCSVDPYVIGAQYTEDGDTMQVLVDVHEPRIRDEALGQWFMLFGIKRSVVEGITDFTAAVRGHVPTDHYAAAFARAEAPAAAKELWRAWLTDEEESYLRPMMERLTWEDKDLKGKKSFFIGAFNLYGQTCYVGSQYDILVSGDRMTYLTEADGTFLRKMLQHREGVTTVPPYGQAQIGDFTADAPEERSYLTGTMLEWSKDDRYFLLEVTRADESELVGKKVRVSTTQLDAGGVPVIGSSVDVEYDGTVEEGDPPMVYALDLVKIDSDQLGGPGDPDRTFTGKVIKLSENGREALLECYDKEKFDTVWVYLPEGWSAQIGDEYSITHTGAVDDSNPPRVSPENISWVSSTPTSNTTESTTGTTVEPTSTTTTTAATTTTTTSTTTTTTTTASTTTTTTTEPTTTTTTKTKPVAATNAVTTKPTAGTSQFSQPKAQFTLNCMGETVLFTYEKDVGSFSVSTEESLSDLTFVSEEEIEPLKKDTLRRLRYYGQMADGRQVSCDVLPESGEILRIAFGGGKKPSQCTRDEQAVQNKILSLLHKMGYGYTEIDMTTEVYSDGVGSYYAWVMAQNDTDGGVFIYACPSQKYGWYIVHMHLDVNNRLRKPNWTTDIDAPTQNKPNCKLIVLGKDITEGTKVFIHKDKGYAELPFTAILEELGATVDRNRSKTDFFIFYGSDEYKLVGLGCALYLNSGLENWLQFPSGEYYSGFQGEVKGGEFMVNHRLTGLIFERFGVTCIVDYDTMTIEIKKI